MGLNPTPIGIGSRIGGGVGTEDPRIKGDGQGRRRGGLQPFHMLDALSFSGNWQADIIPTAPAAPKGQQDLLVFGASWPFYEGLMSIKGNLPQRLVGTLRFMSSVWRVEDDGTGSGSNSWHVTTELVRNPADNRHEWDTYPAPRGSIWFRPRYFTEADLPIERRLEIDRATCCAVVGVRFTRQGAGTRKLAVRSIGTHSGL